MTRLGRLGPAWITFVVLTLAGASFQTIGHDVLSPRLDVVDLFGARLVDVAAGDWWRLLTAPFVSSQGWPHALLNIAGAALVIRPLEREKGTPTAVMVCAVSLIGAFAAGVWGHGVQWLSAGGSGAVVGCAGYEGVRWGRASVQARFGAALVVLFAFGEPLMAMIAGSSPRGSLPAHLGALATGAAIGTVAVERAGVAGQAVAAAAVAALAAGALVPLALPLLPRPAERLACGSPLARSTATGAQTRLLFVNPSRLPLSVRWITPTGQPGHRYPFSADRRGRMPWYGYAGAVYEVTASDGSCVTVVRARHNTATIVLSAHA